MVKITIHYNNNDALVLMVGGVFVLLYCPNVFILLY